MSRLTDVQRRVLRIIKRQEDGLDGHGHDAEGDLSLCSGNLTRTLSTLRSNGYIESYTVREPDGYFTEIVLTRAGRQVAS